MDTELLAKLESLKRRDIETREKLLREGRLYGTYADEMQTVHVENAEALAGLVRAHGWPGVAKVGLEGSRAAWLVAQHAICTPALQREFLRLLHAAAEAGEVPWRQVAYLTDRVRFNEGRPQVYGTVLDWDANGVLGCEVEHPRDLDARRQSVGLSPFAEYLTQQREAVAAEGGAPPVDFATYKRAAREWAKKVGWR